MSRFVTNVEEDIKFKTMESKEKKIGSYIGNESQFMPFLMCLPPHQKWLCRGSSSWGQRNGVREVLLYHLEAHLLLAFPTGMVRMRFSQGKAALLLSICFRYISGLKRWLWAGLSSQLPCIMMFEVPKTNLQIKVWKQAFHKCRTAWIHFQA